MSEGERLDTDRRTFLKQFAMGAAAVPFVTHGVFRFPDIGGWGRGHGYTTATAIAKRRNDDDDNTTTTTADDHRFR